MKRILIFAALLAGLFVQTAFAQEPERVQQTNPIIWADVPDTSVVRVGDTYYMSSTTMHLSPGLPIYYSKDGKTSMGAERGQAVCGFTTASFTSRPLL